MANQAGEVIHDDSHANMWRLFKMHKTDGTVNEYKEWIANLGELQSVIKVCPWCKNLPALRVLPDEGRLLYDVKCEYEFCAVQPTLMSEYDNPEEAIAEWSNHG